MLRAGMLQWANHRNSRRCSRQETQRRAAVREAVVWRHHRGAIEGPLPETPSTITAFIVLRGLRGNVSPIGTRDAKVSWSDDETFSSPVNE